MLSLLKLLENVYFKAEVNIWIFVCFKKDISLHICLLNYEFDSYIDLF